MARQEVRAYPMTPEGLDQQILDSRRNERDNYKKSAVLLVDKAVAEGRIHLNGNEDQFTKLVVDLSLRRMFGYILEEAGDDVNQQFKDSLSNIGIDSDESWELMDGISRDLPDYVNRGRPIPRAVVDSSLTSGTMKNEPNSPILPLTESRAT